MILFWLIISFIGVFIAGIYIILQFEKQRAYKDGEEFRKKWERENK